MKYLLIIGDGMADDKIPSLGGKTPIEAAQKPFLDSLAARGTLGSVRTIPEGFPPGSDTAIMSIFGCDPRKCYSGRAPLELAAAGRILPAGAAAYRCNMATLEEGELPFGERRILSHSAGSIEAAESDALVTALFEHPDFAPLAERAGLEVLPGHSFRHLALQRDAELDGIRLAPPHDHLGEACGALLPSGCKNAAVLRELMEKSFVILSKHPINAQRRAEGKLPANCVWFWAEGRGATLPSFVEAYGAEGGVISAVPLCHGIARLVGLSPVSVPGATGEWDTDYEAKLAAALEVLETRDFAAIHLEGPDEATHNHDLPHKIYSVECLSERVAKKLCAELSARGEDFRLLILSDHLTLMANGAHDGRPVPFILYDSREREKGSGLPYTEENGGKGPFVDAGVKLMPLLFEKL
ncbi:MAG: 2,3-bisphosphoglycerate-independent phosphoglycerate mutase [Oscillospiraceae bacterium]